MTDDEKNREALREEIRAELAARDAERQEAERTDNLTPTQRLAAGYEPQTDAQAPDDDQAAQLEEERIALEAQTYGPGYARMRAHYADEAA